MLLPLNDVPEIKEEPIFDSKHSIFIFKCPMCQNVLETDSNMEPMCTGPNPSLDEHDFMMMELQGSRSAKPAPKPKQLVIPGFRDFYLP